jgi:hypothetical protein
MSSAPPRRSTDPVTGNYLDTQLTNGTGYLRILGSP